MKFEDSWYWPDGEQHMLQWMRDKRNRLIINDRPSYQGRKQLAAIKHCGDRLGVAVDVGSHIGLWSYNLQKVFKTVIAYEPVVEHRDCFRKNVTGENVTLVPNAVGAEKGCITMRVNPTSTGDSWVDPAVHGGGVMMVRLDDALPDTTVDFLKIDCEGFEENVVIGAEGILARDRPVICIEQKRDMAAKFGLKPQGGVHFLERLGYVVLEEIAGDYIMGWKR
jgi:FkbM family methyltransferase